MFYAQQHFWGEFVVVWRLPTLLCGVKNKDFGILGSILGPRYFGKLPFALRNGPYRPNPLYAGPAAASAAGSESLKQLYSSVFAVFAEIVLGLGRLLRLFG